MSAKKPHHVGDASQKVQIQMTKQLPAGFRLYTFVWRGSWAHNQNELQQLLLFVIFSLFLFQDFQSVERKKKTHTNTLVKDSSNVI